MKWYEDPVYIKQCEKAEEIQEKHKWNDGDFMYDHRVGHNIIWCYQCLAYMSDTRKKQEHIWLPRQDELQEMLIEKYPRPIDRDPTDWFCFGVPGFRWSDDFGYDDDEKEISYYRQFTSMEQLWLAFVQYGLYQEKWNSEDWIKDAIGKD